MANIKVKEQNKVEELNKKEAFFLKYKKPIIGAVIALIVIFGGYNLYKNFVSNPREAKASTALAKCQELFANQQWDEALNGNKKGVEGFLKIATDYSSADAGNLANLYAGLCYANLDKWNEAVQYLEKFSTSNDQLVSPAAVGALGNAYAHVNQLDKAVENLRKAAGMADKQAADGVSTTLAPTFLLQAAEILESQGKKGEALAIYKEIKTKYVASNASRDIDKYIERAAE